MSDDKETTTTTTNTTTATATVASCNGDETVQTIDSMTSSTSLVSSSMDEQQHNGCDEDGDDGDDDDDDTFLGYKPTASKVARQALETLRKRLSDRITTLSNNNGSLDDNEEQELRLESMKEKFDLDLLTQFYNQLMIPNFPLEEERDDLEDWLIMLDPSLASNDGNDNTNNCSMDVLILRIGKTILGGIAFEYYHQAETGLLSYMVVSSDFRRLGILGSLHPVLVEALQSLHRVCSSPRTTSPIRAILAETNTLTAGDVPPKVAQKRHEILHKLGYRLLRFPYVQPPLATDVDSFDDIMLLIHVGHNHYDLDPQQKDNHDNKGKTQTTISTQVLYGFVLDFYHSVFGNDNEDFHQHWYYQLVTWYKQRYPTTTIQHDLPWEDVTPQMKEMMRKEKESS